MFTMIQPFLKIIRWWYRNTSPADLEMGSYWKKGGDGVNAKVTKAEDGSTVMIMEGEKYPFPTFPRSHILYGHLSKIKHEIKNQIFNESWARLEEGVDKEWIIKDIKNKLFGSIAKLAEQSKYDMLPVSAMCPSVKEIYRAWTKVSPQTWQLRNYLCFILQEDDAYRFRVQWLYQWFGFFFKIFPVESFKYSLQMLEHGEVVGDMKERIRLLRRILMLALEDKSIKKQFIALFREIKWSKVKLSKADKYHFRGKYFKVDMKYLEY